MKLKKYFITFLSTSLLVANTLITSNAMGKVPPNEVVNGAPQPKSGAAATYDRCAKLAGTATEVAAHTAKSAGKGAVKGAVAVASVPIVGAVITRSSPQVSASLIAGGAAVGALTEACEGYQEGREAARYPKPSTAKQHPKSNTAKPSTAKPYK